MKKIFVLWAVIASSPIESSAHATCSFQVTSHQGVVLAHPKIVNVYWDSGLGTYWTSSAGASIRAAHDQAWSFIANSALLSQRLGEYGVGSTSWSGSYLHTGGPIGPITDPLLETMLAQDFQYGLIPFIDSSTIYLIYFSPNVSIAGASGFHSSFAYSNTKAIYAWIDNADYRRMDEIASHEIYEAATDPYITGWYTSQVREGEVGDLCANEGGNGPMAGLATQAVWSQRLCRCVGNTDVLLDDFDGDGVPDFTIWAPGSGTWGSYSGYNPTTPWFQPWGLSGDIPVAGDYDGDGIADYAVFRPAEGNWYIIYSSIGFNNGQRVFHWGQNGDVPVPADYDGDGKADVAYWHPATGAWNILYSSGGSLTNNQWGLNGDTPVPGDYDGDGKADLAVWRPSSLAVWYIIGSHDWHAYSVQWGLSPDAPVPGDYDGDGIDDLAIWRSGEAKYYILPSNNSGWYSRQVGNPGDIPVPRKWFLAGKTLPETWRPSDGLWSSVAPSFNFSWGSAPSIPAEKLIH